MKNEERNNNKNTVRTTKRKIGINWKKRFLCTRTVNRINYVLISGIKIKLCFSFEILDSETFIGQLKKVYQITLCAIWISVGPLHPGQ